VELASTEAGWLPAAATGQGGRAAGGRLVDGVCYEATWLVDRCGTAVCENKGDLLLSSSYTGARKAGTGD
jgi:hypothetical protein